MPLLTNMLFIVTGSGRFFRNIQLDPTASLGVVKVDSDDAGYHIPWGLANEVAPISELPAHFLSYCGRIKAINDKDRVIMHYRAANLVALAYVLENDTAVFTRQLWGGNTKYLIMFPDGVDVLPWMVPGTDGVDQAIAQRMQRRLLVLWSFHSVSDSKPMLDEIFNLIDTAGKSTQVSMEVYSIGDMKQAISREGLITLGKHFGVTPPASALTPQEANMIRRASVMQVSLNAHERYQHRYNPIWPELEAVLKSYGMHNYAIYLDKACNLLFATVKIESEE